MPNPRKPRTFIPSKYTRYTVVRNCTYCIIFYMCILCILLLWYIVLPIESGYTLLADQRFVYNNCGLLILSLILQILVDGLSKG